MSAQVSAADDGNELYEEREAVGVFRDEAALNAAVDALIDAGLSPQDMSVLAHSERLSGGNVAALEDAGDSPRASYVAPDTRAGALAATAATPALLAGLGLAAVVGTGGAALVPTLAVTLGGTAAGGAIGVIFARAFGRRHAANVERQIVNGGLLLWVHAPDPAKDATIVSLLKANGAQDVHIHVCTRSWGPADVPLHDFNPDPLLGRD
ncbi:hypothetical protein [Ancylobacter terrae]|uniref:hypothetical protein n=1 Tax=Ancylobacter sp. sgz301288 TaxID=3342077 RepID=UPI00385CF5E8